MANNSPLYDVVLASRNDTAVKLFEKANPLPKHEQLESSGWTPGSLAPSQRGRTFADVERSVPIVLPVTTRSEAATANAAQADDAPSVPGCLPRSS